MWSHRCQLLTVVMARTIQTVSRISLIQFPPALTATICVFTGACSQITAPWWLLTAHQKDWHAHSTPLQIRSGRHPGACSFLGSIYFCDLHFTPGVTGRVTKRPSFGGQFFMWPWWHGALVLSLPQRLERHMQDTATANEAGSGLSDGFSRFSPYVSCSALQTTGHTSDRRNCLDQGSEMYWVHGPLGMITDRI